VRTRAGVVGAILRKPLHAPRRSAPSSAAPTSCSITWASAIAATSSPKHLSYGDQRRLEIARALATEPRLLRLDEPAAGMNATEKVELRKLLVAIRADGITLLLIEHDVKLVMGLCDACWCSTTAARSPRAAARPCSADPR
jgi:branched-chain amino acid transport system ATP-binding protein